MLGWLCCIQVQVLCLWVIWWFLFVKQDLIEKDVNEVFKVSVIFGDYVQIWCFLIENGLMKRMIDGVVYWCIECKLIEEV